MSGCFCCDNSIDPKPNTNGSIISPENTTKDWDVKVIQPKSVQGAMNLPAEIYKTTTQDIIVQQFGYYDYSIEIKAGSAIGDNYMGVVYRIVVTDNDSGQCKNIILKIPPQNAIRQKEFQTHTFFDKEITIYEEVLPMFTQFQETKGINVFEEGFHEYPTCYRSLRDDTLEAIYFEDLKQTGFEMFSRFEEPTFDHARLLMEALGKMHALSFAFKDQEAIRFAKYKDLEDSMDGSSSEKMAQMFIHQITKSIDCLDPGQDATVIKILETICDPVQMGEKMKNLINGKIMDQYSVICHGDCWNNNMMFKNDKDGKPVDIRLLDFQISRYASPALDIVYYIFCSTHRTLRDRYFEDLLKIYHKTLTQFLTRLGSDAEQIFPYSALKSELKRVGLFGYLMAAMVVPLTMQAPEDTVDMDKMAEKVTKGENVELVTIGQGGKLEQKYNKRMREIILDIYRFGYFD